ncbi:MAG: YvcK family protein, partial [Cyanobacteria bacterium]|nr:YvcK family protein [Cyanobacteriota bacterium]MDW8202219.1 YvcK family protein [Cyanobacteriota bacterium SKYGB_h_bin112]
MSNSLFKQALSTLSQETRRVSRWMTPSPKTASLVMDHSPRWVKWLTPGLFVKRWLLLSVGGVFLTMLGIAIWANLSPIYYTIRFIRDVLRMVTQVVPSQISGPIVIVVGILLVLWGQTRTLGSITEVLMPDGDDELVDRLLTHRRLHRGPKIVAIGGGTGLSTLLRGLKEYSANITAIVTVADDGGSSGRLRREIGVLPPGDIRNCLAALADEEKLVTELFQYRFQAGDGLVGHSFGNLFLTAMTEVTGDLERAIAASSEVLAVRGRVLPATISDVRLWAELQDGRVIEGESNITAAKGKICKIGCYPPEPPALPTALEAIHAADYIVIGPGSLYTSVIPNLLVPEITRAIAARTDIPRIYVCNIMTEPGETDGYTVADHIHAIDRACGQVLFNAVLVQRHPPSAATLAYYARSGAHPVMLDRDRVQQLGRRIVLANVMQENET